MKTYKLYCRSTDKLRPNELVDTVQAQNMDEAIRKFEQFYGGKYVIWIEGGKMGHTVVLHKKGVIIQTLPIEEFYRAVIAKYGRDLQSIVAMEELSELQKEIAKFLRSKGDVDHLIEEMADVQIMLEQLKIIYAVKQEEIDAVKRKKIERLSERMKGF